MKKRLFIAIDIPESVKSVVARIEEELSKSISGRWIDPGNLHLTLKFLGYVDEEMVPGIEDAVAGAVTDFSNFILRLSDIGLFPNIRKPRVLWVGLIDEDNSCGKIQRILDRSLSGLGFEKEKRPFQPHVTLCRIKKQVLIDLEFPKVDPASFEVRELILFQSTLTPKGAIYEAVKKFPLQGLSK